MFPFSPSRVKQGGHTCPSAAAPSPTPACTFPLCSRKAVSPSGHFPISHCPRKSGPHRYPTFLERDCSPSLSPPYNRGDHTCPSATVPSLPCPSSALSFSAPVKRFPHQATFPSPTAPENPIHTAIPPFWKEAVPLFSPRRTTGETTPAQRRLLHPLPRRVLSFSAL